MKSTLNSQLQSVDRLLRFGGGLTVLGMILTLGAMSPAVFGGSLSSVWWALSMLTGVGLVLLLVGIRRATSVRSRAAGTLKQSSRGDQ